MTSTFRSLRIAQFKSALVSAQRDREYLPMVNHDIPYWNTYEMLVMWKLVNMMRQAHERPFVPFSAIERVEQMAAGHIDYTDKFSLYCSDLVDVEALGVKP